MKTIDKENWQQEVNEIVIDGKNTTLVGNEVEMLCYVGDLSKYWRIRDGKVSYHEMSYPFKKEEVRGISQKDAQKIRTVVVRRVKGSEAVCEASWRDLNPFEGVEHVICEGVNVWMDGSAKFFPNLKKVSLGKGLEMFDLDALAENQKLSTLEFLDDFDGGETCTFYIHEYDKSQEELYTQILEHKNAEIVFKDSPKATLETQDKKKN